MKVPSLFPNHYPKRKKKSNRHVTLLGAKHVQCKNDYLKTCFKFDPEELAHLLLGFLMDWERMYLRKNDWVTSRGPDLHGIEEREREIESNWIGYLMNGNLLPLYSWTLLTNPGPLTNFLTPHPFINPCTIISLIINPSTTHTAHYNHYSHRLLTLPLPFTAPCPQGEEKKAAAGVEIPRLHLQVRRLTTVPALQWLLWISRTCFWSAKLQQVQCAPTLNHLLEAR